MKEKLFFAKENLDTGLSEYKILKGIHPFQSEQIMSFKMSYATRPVNHAGYYTISINGATRYVFEAEEKQLAEQHLLELAQTRFNNIQKSSLLEGIDLTSAQCQPKCTDEGEAIFKRELSHSSDSFIMQDSLFD